MIGLTVAVVSAVIFFCKPTRTCRWAMNYTKSCASAWRDLFVEVGTNKKEEKKDNG